MSVNSLGGRLNYIVSSFVIPQNIFPLYLMVFSPKIFFKTTTFNNRDIDASDSLIYEINKSIFFKISLKIFKSWYFLDTPKKLK